MYDIAVRIFAILGDLPIMSTLAEIYDRAFFATYGAANQEYAAACQLIGEEIARRFAPRTAVDWGCGAGLHAAALAERGVDVIAVDGVEVAAEQRAAGLCVRVADITRPLPDGVVFARYDLSLCIDVLEHIAEGAAAAALANITRGASLLIASCAPPGQGGHHHVNEQPRRYWVARLAALGWRYDRRATGAMERHFLTQRDRLRWSWMYHNLCVYRPSGQPIAPPGRPATPPG